MDARHHPQPLDPSAARQPMPPAMSLALQASFGSVERWREAFMAKALSGGSGSVRMVFMPQDGLLVNQSAPDPAHSQAGGIPLLSLDMNAHESPRGLDAAGAPSMDTLIEGIDWAPVYARYQAAVDAASEPLAATADELAGARILDVRRAAVFQQAGALIPDAQWQDPAEVARWCAELPRDKPVVVYCVYGHEVSRATALRLRAGGVDARFLQGGIDGWQSAGRPLAARLPHG